MKKHQLSALFTTVLVLFFFHDPSFTFAEDFQGRQAVIMFEEETDRELLEQYSQSINHVFKEIPAASITITSAQKKALELSPHVASVTYDMPVQSAEQSMPYGYKLIGTPDRIPSSLTGAGIKIGVLDSGIDMTHPDLQKRVAGGTCLMTIVDPSGCPDSYRDDAGHGTHVAGIIAANNNTFGTIGVAPSASLYAIKVLDENGYGTTSTMIAGVEWAIRQKLDILNVSVTTPVYEAALESIMKKAYDAGMLIIGAAGNSGAPAAGAASSVEYPAKLSSVIAVSSIGEGEKIDPLSSYGSEVELAAPGVKIYSTYPNSAYGYSTGTSMAAPYVAGLAALYMEKYPEMSNIQIRSLLQKNARDIGPSGKDSYFGFGLVQADRNPVNHGIELTYTTDGKGKTTINTSQLAARFGTYNVYRGETLIGQNVTSSEWVDYASKGTVSYYFHPVTGGVEEATSFVTLKAETAHPAWSDLRSVKWYDRYITFLLHESVMSGFQDSTIRPEAKITRGEAAVLLGKSLGLSGTARNTSFHDVTQKVSSSGYIQSLRDAGIISGYEDGTFRPGAAVTRAEMAIFISRAYQITPEESSEMKDVTKAVTGYQYINGTIKAGIAGGYTDGTFRPYTEMNRAQFAAFLARALNKQLR